ncbi:MAG: AGE family epimerase/isomerase [Bdellovibrionales bacterium]|nr:AGE family epimerase/isomerase [Bdellovibrionales bacterium]
MQEQCREWLKPTLRLWLERGIDPRGGFIENLNLEGKAQPGSQRAMVQARQIYSLRVAKDLEVADSALAKKAIADGTSFMIKSFALPSGGFAHSVQPNGQLANSTPELYTQAFVLFGLANAYSVKPEAQYKDVAIKLVDYLKRERRVAKGGFSELVNGKSEYQSNPHMHLFEAAVAWMEVDPDPEWRALADEVLNLALTCFIDPDTGALAEFFTADWVALKENGRFVFEPGHQYEWAWLMGRYQRLSGRDLLSVRQKLFTLSEKHGICKDRFTAHDQVWSDFHPKLTSSRFWPQTERIKAACQLQASASADEAMKVLFRYLPQPGIWYDRWEVDGSFTQGPVKGSSLYHIIGAMNEYLTSTVHDRCARG